MTPVGVGVEEVDELFERSRRDFLKKWPKDRLVPNYIMEMFSQSTINRIRNEPNYNFGVNIKRRFIAIMSGVGIGAYHQLAELIGQKEREREEIIEEYSGRYKYYRYFEEGVNHEWVYTSGSVEIFNYNSVPSFVHKSGNAPAGILSEHEGFVFMCNKTIYMLGKRRGALRLAISSMLNDIETSFNWGVVASMRIENPYPFGAKYALVHERNAALNAELSGPDGRKAFDKMLKGDGAYYIRGI